MIRQVLKGDGIAFIGAMGVLTHKVLAPGEKLIVDTCVEIKIYSAFLRPPRHRRNACSTAWRCRFSPSSRRRSPARATAARWVAELATGRAGAVRADDDRRRRGGVDGHRVRETHGHLEPIGRLRMQRILRQDAIP